MYFYDNSYRIAVKKIIIGRAGLRPRCRRLRTEYSFVTKHIIAVMNETKVVLLTDRFINSNLPCPPSEP